MLDRGDRIVAAVREEENAPLLKRSGADTVIVSAGKAGRSAARAARARPRRRHGGRRHGDGGPHPAGPAGQHLVIVVVVERPVVKTEAGYDPRRTDDLVVGVVHGHRVLGYDERSIDALRPTDR